MNISNRISEIEKEIMFYCREKGVDFIINTSSIEGFKLGKQMGREQREKEIEEIIDNFDTEKYIGEYCFKASSFRKELKSKLKGEGK
jgi:hypothetical protein